MMFSDVPMHSCIRSASGTWMTPNTSYSTGTMTPPPPMPNRPARMPVTKPPARISSTSQASSPIGYPNSIWHRMTLSGALEKSGGDVRHIGDRVQTVRRRICHDSDAAPSTRARARTCRGGGNALGPDDARIVRGRRRVQRPLADGGLLQDLIEGDVGADDAEVIEI